MNTSVAFIACIENNRLASETLLLAKSIRKFGGRLSNSTIYTFNPRGNGRLSKAHYDELHSLEIRHSDEILNTIHSTYPQANKCYAAARTEELAKEDVLVFLDSDSVFLNEPLGFLLPEHVVAAATPVWAAGIGSRGPDDPADAVWRTARSICNVSSKGPRVRTRLTQNDVGFYCNAGLVAARRSTGLFSQWLNCFTQLSSNPIIRNMLSFRAPSEPSISIDFFLDQIALTIALLPRTSEIVLLDERYNCPLHNRHLLEEAYPDKQFDLDTIVHFHYNRSFHEIGFIESFEPPFSPKSTQYKWLVQHLPLEPFISRAHKSCFIGEFDKQMQQWREWLAKINVSEQ